MLASPPTSTRRLRCEWWDDFYAALEQAGRIDRFDRFTVANASGPAAVIRDVGGFDEGFVGYGLEDYELGVRLLGAGTHPRFDADAVAWHPDIPPLSLLVTRQRSLGRNAARLARLHPETARPALPARQPAPAPPPPAPARGSARPPPCWPSPACRCWGARHPAADRGVARRREHLARAAAHASGVAAGDPSGVLLAGCWATRRPRGRPTAAARSSRRASRQPATNPTSSDQTISR